MTEAVDRSDMIVGLSLIFHAAARLVSRPYGQAIMGATTVATPPGMHQVSDPTVVDGVEFRNLVRACHEFTRWSLHMEAPSGWQEVIKDAFLEGRYHDAIEILMMEYLVILHDPDELSLLVTDRADGKRTLRFQARPPRVPAKPLIQESAIDPADYEETCQYCGHRAPECSRGG